MKALSLHEPYASLIACGSKTEEYRSWKTNYRGDLLICASSYQSNVWKNILPVGVALAVVTLDDCLPDDDGDYKWMLSNVRPIVPFPVKGKQRIFEVDSPVEYVDRYGEDDLAYYWEEIGLITLIDD